MRWVGLRFKNIQSWESGYIPLNPHGLTVITAPSETGKSVYIKCLRIALFFKHIHPDDRKSIIRDGYKEGYLEIDLEDGSTVRLTFRPTTFEVQVTKGEEVSSWREFFPNEVKDMLGLVVNTELRLILNLMDQESPMLFDGTSNDYNDEILGFYANHDDLLHRQEVLTNWQGIVDKSISNKSSTLRYIEDEMSRIPIIDDFDSLENSLILCEELNEDLKLLDELNIKLQSSLALVEPVDYNCNKVRSLYSLLDLLFNINKRLNNTLNIDNYHVEVDLNNPKVMLDELSYLQNALGTVSKLGGLEEPLPKADLTNCSTSLEDLHYLSKAVNLINSVGNLDIPPKVDLDIDYKESYNQLEIISELYSKLKSLLECIDNVEDSSIQLEESKQSILKLREEFKVCALCGSILSEEVHSECQ